MQAPREVNPAPRAFRVRFANLEREADCLEGESLFHCARRAGVRIVGACGGRGACGSCAVRVLSGEVELFSPAGATPGRRRLHKHWLRACEHRPRADCVVEIGPRSLAPIVRADVDRQGGDQPIFEPAVRVCDAALLAPTLEENGADAERLLDALSPDGAARIDFAVLHDLPGQLRACGWHVRAVLRTDEVIAVAPAASPCLGLAVDLGTTNVAGFLVDMESGARLASLGIENPQAAFGADLISRVNHAIRDPGGAAELRGEAVAAFATLANDMCKAVTARAEDISEIVVCGNTAMHHLLLGLPVAQLGRAPFVPAVCSSLDLKARELGIPAAAGAYVHVMPNVGGFVGGDHVAVLLATEPEWRDATAIVMDIGTNTEISLIHEGAITSVSSPSGPALEGGHIACGMRAAEGAIEKVRIEGSQIAIQVIGNVDAVGLCGSGVIDLVASLRMAGIIDKRGWICRDDHAAVRDSAGQREIVLAPDVVFTQADVRAVQLAKAAIRAGIELLVQRAGLDETAIERVLIAGAFGAYIDLDSAVAIGLVPGLPRERFRQVGNAAGLGARMALTSVSARARAKRLAAECRYIELGTMAGFQKALMRRIGFD